MTDFMIYSCFASRHSAGISLLLIG